MLEWEEKYSVGVDKIDKEHAELFDAGNRIWNTMHSNDLEKLHKIEKEVQALEVYATKHFVYEEVYMKEHGINLSEIHIKEHRNFMEKIQGMLSRECATVKEEECYDLIIYIVKWINHHILVTDSDDFNKVDKSKIGI